VEVSTLEFTAEDPSERFTGHVTLASIKGIKRRDAEALGQGAAGMAEKQFGDWTAHGVELMRSELSPDGARYTSLAAIPLPGLVADMA
jgi:2'-5' RNA ligase